MMLSRRKKTGGVGLCGGELSFRGESVTDLAWMGVGHRPTDARTGNTLRIAAERQRRVQRQHCNILFVDLKVVLNAAFLEMLRYQGTVSFRG